jgi:predicted Zn finger-like uncharacterized protein
MVDFLDVPDPPQRATPMPIPTSCPSCQARFSLADELAGKTVRCQRCQTTFSVPQPEALPEAVPVVEPAAEEAELVEPAVDPRQTITATALPAAPPRRRPVGEPAPRGPRPVASPRGGNGWVIGLIAGGAGLVLLLAAGVLVWLLLRKEEPVPPVAGGPPDGGVAKADFGQPMKMEKGVADKGGLGQPQPGKPAGELARIQGPGRDLFTLRFSPDSKVLGTVSLQSQVDLWEVPTGRHVGSVGLGPGLRGTLAFTPDSKHVAAWNGHGPVVVSESPGGKEVRRLEFDGPGVGFVDLDIAPDGKTVVAARGPAVRAWRLETGEPVKLPGADANPANTARITSARFVTATSFVTAGSGAGLQREALVWDLNGAGAPRPLKGFAQKLTLTAPLEVSPSGAFVWAPNLGAVEFLDWKADRSVLQLRSPRGLSQRNAVAFLPDEKAVVTNHLERSVTLWEFPTGRELRNFQLPADEGPPRTSSASGVAVSPDGRYLATLRGNTVTLWDLNVVLPR